MPKPKECEHKPHALRYTAHFSNVVTLTQVQLKPAHTSDSVLTSLSHLQDIPLLTDNCSYHASRPAMPVNNAAPTFFCEHCCCLRVVKTQHLLQHCVNQAVGSTDCACKTPYWVSHKNTCMQERVVLNIINSVKKNYTQPQHKVFTQYSHIFHTC